MKPSPNRECRPPRGSSWFALVVIPNPVDLSFRTLLVCHSEPKVRNPYSLRNLSGRNKCYLSFRASGEESASAFQPSLRDFHFTIAPFPAFTCRAIDGRPFGTCSLCPQG